ALQHALLPEADNVADSEDSEDEWNYYRVGPNKEKDTVASSEELHEIKNDNEIKNVEHLDEDNNVEEPPRSPTSEHNSSSECESQKGEEILPELINTDISVEEKREIDSAFVKLEKEEEEEQKEVEKGEAEEEEKEHGVEEGEGEEEKKEHSEEKEEEKEEKEGGGDEEEEDKQEQEEDMDFQLNPNAAEFIPISPPKRQIKINTINDSLVAGSPLKTIAMDDIKVPSQKEFDEEISARPHEIEEEDSSPNGDHATPFDYDFYTEQQKVINPLSAAAAAVAAGLDESEISSTKAEYGDETMSFLCTTTTDLHKTEISTMEESFGDSDCDIYNRDNPMTMSYTPCDFKAAFNKEVDLNAVHDLSDGDLEDENCSSEGQTPQSPKVILSTDIEERRTEFDTLSNGDSSSQVQTASLLSKDDATFLKFEDSNEPKTTEFIQVELERHRQSSPIKFEQDFSKEEEEKSSPLLENKDEMIHVVTREKEEEKEEEEEEEKEKEKEKENERVETPKEAEYIDDEKDNIATDNDIITNSDSEFIVDKPIEIATDLIQSEILQDTISQEQHNFLSSTIDESLRSVSPSMPSIEREFIGTSPEPLKNDLIASMENLTLAKEEKDRPIMVSNLYSNVSEYQPNQSSFDLFASGEPALSDISSKPSLLDDSMDLIAQTVPKEHPESCFLPTPISEPISNDRPIENLLELKETTTEVPITDHIEESKAEECPKSSSSFEDIVEKPSQLMEESVCFFDTNKHIDLSQDIHLKLEDSSETKPTDKIEINVNEFEKINGTVALNLSESIQEFTGLEKQLEPENITPEESPMTETAPLVEDKITKEDILEHEEPVAQEAVEEKLLLDTKEEGEEEEEGLEAKEDVEIVQVAETTRSVGTTELTEFSKSTELVTPVENVEIEKASDAFELVTPVETTEISTPTDTEKTVVSTDIVESEISEKIIEITKPIDTTTMGIIDTAEVAGTTEIAGTAEIAGTGEITETALIADATEIVGTAEIAETADTAKTIDISEDVSVTQDIEKQEVTEPVKVEESQKIEGEAAVEQPAVAVVATEGIVAAAAAATAAGLVTTVAATSTSNKAKAKPTTKSMKPGSSASTKAAAPKSTPTSPSKTVSSTTRPTTSATTTKKPAGTAAARPKHLDTTATKSQTSTNTAKSSATKTVSASKTSTTATSTTKTAARPSSALTKSKPASASARSTTTSTVEKKSILNGDVKSLSKTTVTKAATKSTITSTSTAAKTSTSKTTTGSRTSSSTTTATTTTALSTTGKSRPTSAITAAKSPAKSAGTNAASSSLNATKSKATTTSNNTAKTRTSLAKSPMIDKQIKETANKQISMARTTSSPMSKTTTRSSMSATTILNANTITSTTKRLSSQKSTSTTVAHSPVKKVTSKVASGHSSGATTTKSSSTTKVKVMQNGTADNVEITKTATTIITTNSKNEDDVPKKDLSPVVAHTDNQLISSAD
ncbi:mucin-22-like isoform X16, partial [Vespula maculifrons]